MASPRNFRLTTASARELVRAMERACNRRDVESVVSRCSECSRWRGRHASLCGREAIRAYLQRGWARQLDATTVKQLWAWTEQRIAVRFDAEWRNGDGDWFRTRGAELWEFNDEGLLSQRYLSASDIPIDASERRLDPQLEQD